MKSVHQYVSLITLATLALASLAGCAMVHPGVMAIHLDARGQVVKEKHTPRGVAVSCEIDRELSNTSTKLMHVTFENTSRQWYKVPEITASFRRPELTSLISFPSGEDLNVWADAMVAQQALAAQNRAVFLGALTLTGAVVSAAGAASDNRTAEGVGTAMMATGLVGAAAVNVGEAVAAENRMLETAPLYPENHLLAGKLNLPPNLFVRKFLLVYTKGAVKGTDLMYLDLNYSDGEVETAALPINCNEMAINRYRR